MANHIIQITWTPTRAEGLRRLDQFLPLAGRNYAGRRNYDLGPGNHRHVSILSPWIRHRLITEEEVVSAVLEQHSYANAEKFIQEVFWRTYWKGWLEARPNIWRDYTDAVRDLCSRRDSDLLRRWDAATSGESGIDCFDAWAHELIETGYLHNHARMWFASIWIFTLKLPWVLGADFFLRHLLDGDPASNTLSWRWVAGLHTRGKTYLARSGNIAKYTEGRFDPTNQLSGSAPPLHAAPLPAPRSLTPTLNPDPALPTGLLLTEEDLDPEFAIVDLDVRAVTTLQTTQSRSPLPVPPSVSAFARGAIDDAGKRLGNALGLPVFKTSDSAAIVDWAHKMGIQQIVSPYIPVGPTRDATAALRAKLSAAGIAYVPRVRNWDRQAWPHATHGFFQLRKQIPELLRETRT